MSTTVAQMTTDELKEMIESIIEQKLAELLADPDNGLVLRPEVEKRWRQQMVAVADGERGKSLNDVIQQLELN
ncbi:MAG TPA: hypothetical protein PLD25_18305 [Chloroflexota bacterium]|nr:hypothetical protein [Chloroflexota bacterium]HUM69903.1 hypothetical protein [Chloroflexota bacterium]